MTRPRWVKLAGCLVVLAGAWAMAAAPAFGQSGVAPPASVPSAAGADGKPLAFEVASVRPSKAGGGHDYGPTADGWHMKNMPLMVAILTAYVPSSGAMMYGTNTMQGFPEWTKDTQFDIDARVAESEQPEWQKPAAQPAMLRAMLAELLTERCKLVLHRDLKEVPVYRLTVSKGGVKITETKEGEAFPPGQPLPGGGVMSFDGEPGFHFYGATMTVFSVLLSNVSGRPVQDETGLPGRYDFYMLRPAMGAPRAAPPEDGAAVDSGPTIFEIVGGLGLKLEPAKGSVETLVVDHVERPSEN